MSRLLLLLGVLASLRYAASPGEGRDANPAGGDLRQPHRGRPPQEESRTFGGTVLAVSSESITIQGMNLCSSGRESTTQEGRDTVARGKALTYYQRTDKGRVVVARGVEARSVNGALVVTAADGSTVTIRRTDFPPMTFRATPFMADGGFDPYRLTGSYRLAEVQVGDAVTVQARRWYLMKDAPKGRVFVPLSEWECDGVQIERRPGGRVPPAHNSGFHHTWHEWVNAMQDLEERGIPLPERYWSEEERRRIAPPPHAARVKIPDAAP